jgi:hypothetical protein
MCSQRAHYSDNIQILSAKMGSIDASYQDDAQKIVAERHLANRTLWIHDKPVLLTGPGCDLDAANSASCDLMVKGAPVPAVHVAAKPHQSPPIAPAANVCETITDLPSAPTTASDKHPPPLQRADLLKALDDYTAALAAIRKAQDRADLDNAAAQASAAVGALAQSAPIPYGAAAGPVAKASSSAVLWLVGQDLGYRRLHELQNATRIACEPMDVLADALEVVLEEQRDASIDAVSKKIEVATGPAGAALNQRLDDLMNQRDAIETAATDAVLAPTRGHCGGATLKSLAAQMKTTAQQLPAATHVLTATATVLSTTETVLSLGKQFSGTAARSCHSWKI